MSEYIDNVAFKSGSVDKSIPIRDSTTFPYSSKQRIVCVGDSYAMPSYSGWPIEFQSLLGLDSSDFYNLNGTGAGFVGGSRTFIDVINSGIGTVSDRTTITRVYILGGYNDVVNGNLEGVLSGAESTFSLLRTYFPNAKLYLGFIGWGLERGTSANNLYDFEKGMNWYRDAAMKNSVCFIENIFTSTHNIKNMRSDMRHPTPAGMKKIAFQLADFHLGGDGSGNSEKIRMNFTLNTNYEWTTEAAEIFTIITGKNVFCHFPDIDLTLKSTSNLNSNSIFEVGQITEGNLRGGSIEGECGVNTNLIIYTRERNYAIPCRVYIQARYFRIKIGHDGNPITNTNFNNITRLVIKAAEFNVPASRY